MHYTKQELCILINDASKDMSLFYKQPFINYRGLTSDTREYYTEVVADYLLGNFYLLNRINAISRVNSYRTEGHDGKTALVTSNREEERIALEMFGKVFKHIGEVLDYQIPLKSKRSDKGIGKIDLLSKNEDIMYILELKNPDSTESMLRCVLEGYTYLRTVDQRKLLIDFELPAGSILKAAPLVFYGRAQYDEYIHGHPNLLKLMDRLDCIPFFLCEHNNSYDVVINSN